MSDDPLAGFSVNNEFAEFCGDDKWTIQMSNGQQMLVLCESIDIEHGAVVVNMSGEHPVMYLPPGSWVVVYRTKHPGGPALPLTHLITPQPVEPMQADPLLPPGVHSEDAEEGK